MASARLASMRHDRARAGAASASSLQCSMRGRKMIVGEPRLAHHLGAAVDAGGAAPR
jgi:hypothetical protein